MQAAFLAVGVLGLGSAWLVPWHEILGGSFAAHMTRHTGLVAVASPCLAAAVAGHRLDPVQRWPALFPPIVASLLELVVVWLWHAPALHHAARHSGLVMGVEQASFLLAGLFVWLAALGGGKVQRGERSGPGLIALLLTLMHMTLLGALLGLAPRPLYETAGDARLDAVLADQHLGGAIMLTVGTAAYVVGGLWLGAELLGHRWRLTRSTSTAVGRSHPAGTGSGA